MKLSLWAIPAVLALTLSGGAGAKPSQKDMGDAVIRNLESRGLERIGDRVVVAKGLFDDIRYELTDLDVSDCTKAEGEEDYLCHKRTKMTMSVTGKDSFDAEGEAVALADGRNQQNAGRRAVRTLE